MKALRILVLDNGESSISLIVDILKIDDYCVNICNDSDKFLEAIYNDTFDLYLINIDGNSSGRLKLIKLLNECQDITMKMVVTSTSDNIKQSFIHGCDECVIKSIDEDEILLRIKALIRRQYNVYSDVIYLKKNIKYNIFDKNLYKGDEQIAIGEKPLQILEYLLKFRDFFISSEDIERNIYPVNTEDKNSVIRYHIHKIRQVLGENIIVSNRTRGYKINIS